MNCECCGKQIDGSYGSGRFCNSRCARSFSTKNGRKEISLRVAAKLKGRSTGRNPWSHACERCGRKFRIAEAVNAHRMHCVFGGPKVSIEGRRRAGWNRGLTRETDERIDRLATSNETPDSVLFTINDRKYAKAAKLRYYRRTPHVCEICGQGAEWNGKFLRLQIDHKNGLIEDNRWENLRKVCPNCHTQTETFTGRNIVKKRKLIAGVTGTGIPLELKPPGLGVQIPSPAPEFAAVGESVDPPVSKTG